MLKFIRESLIVQIIFIVVLGLAAYAVGPWLWEQLTVIFGTYEDSFNPLRY